jgi:hypothetical protein
MKDDYVTEMPEEVRPTWSEGSEPTAAEWQTWFVSLPTEWRELIAARMLGDLRSGFQCFMHDHEGRIADLRRRVDQLTELINLGDGQTVEPWLAWFTSLGTDDRDIAVRAIIVNSYDANRCRSSAHDRWIQQMREALIAADEFIQKGLRQ